MSPNPKYVLEICCYSADDVQVAEEAGAHRVELCNGYAVGGTTPTLGTLQEAKSNSKLPIFVMIRPRGGHFTYSNSEKKVMLNDSRLAIENGAEGIVFGALNNDHTIDEVFCKAMCEQCGDIPITFHRAIDICSNAKDAIHLLNDLGVKTILTSGAEQTAIQGINQIIAWHQLTKNPTHLMAGSGVNAENVLAFAKAGLTHFHSSASILIKSGDPSDKIAFNSSLKNNEISVVSKSKVTALIQNLNSFFK